MNPSRHQQSSETGHNERKVKLKGFGRWIIDAFFIKYIKALAKS